MQHCKIIVVKFSYYKNRSGALLLHSHNKTDSKEFK